MALCESLRLAAFGIALALPVSAVAAQLTDKNSVTPKYAIEETLLFKGTGCNVAKQASVPFAPGALAVRVLAPKVGDRQGDLRITAISVGARAVTFTAVADSARICGPDDGSLGPPAEREWSETFKSDVRLSRRVGTVYRLDFT